jgi:hypothetical protein
MAIVRQPTIKTLFLLPVLVGVMAAARSKIAQFGNIPDWDAMFVACTAMLVWILPGFIAARANSVWKAGLWCFIGFAGASTGLLAFEKSGLEISGLAGPPLIVLYFPVLGFNDSVSTFSTAFIRDATNPVLVIAAFTTVGGILYALVGVAFAWTCRLKEPARIPTDGTNTQHPG